jgi:hypothetical protein
VISVLWFLGAVIYLRTEIHDAANSTYELSVKFCLQDKVLTSDECYHKGIRDRMDWRNSEWPGTLLMAAFPIPLAWLLAWIMIATFRWVRRGFAAPGITP